MIATLNHLNDYPIEIDLPDIRRYTKGNTGIPYVYSFDTRLPGPHTMINALAGGNQICGAIAVKALLDLDVRPRCGRLTLAFANIDAYLRFDRANPYASKYVDQDFGRLWDPCMLDDTAIDSIELRRARQMRPIIDTVDFLLDLRSTDERGAPLNVCGPHDKDIALARQLRSSSRIVSAAGDMADRRLRDYGEFGAPDNSKVALQIQCGQHWESFSVLVAKDSVARFLLATGTLDISDFSFRWFSCLPAAM
jgi:predicted deacylase